MPAVTSRVGMATLVILDISVLPRRCNSMSVSGANNIVPTESPTHQLLQLNSHASAAMTSDRISVPVAQELEIRQLAGPAISKKRMMSVSLSRLCQLHFKRRRISSAATPVCSAAPDATIAAIKMVLSSRPPEQDAIHKLRQNEPVQMPGSRR